MPEEKKQKSPDVLELARKKRHIHLLEKVQSGRALTAHELKELSEFEHSPAPPAGCVKTTKEIAKAFKISHRSAQRWAEEGMPKTSDGFYDLTEIYAWRLAKLEQKNEDESKVVRWEDYFRQYKALLAELEYKRKLSEVVSREEVEQDWIERILTVKKAFLSLPKRLAPQVVGVDIRTAEAVIDKRIREIISGFAKRAET